MGLKISIVLYTFKKLQEYIQLDYGLRRTQRFINEFDRMIETFLRFKLETKARLSLVITTALNISLVRFLLPQITSRALS